MNASVTGSKPLQYRGFFVACLFRVLRVAYAYSGYVAVLHTGVHTICTHGSVKVSIENLQVVFLGDAFAVAEPSRDDVTRKGLGQFGLAGASQVVPHSGPRDQSCPLDDLAKPRSEVDRSPNSLSQTASCRVGGTFITALDSKDST